MPLPGVTATQLKAASAKTAPLAKNLQPTPAKGVTAQLPRSVKAGGPLAGMLAHTGPSLREARQTALAKLPKAPKSGGGGLSLATITGIPAAVASDIPKEFTGTGFVTGGGLQKVEEKGYGNISDAVGVGRKVGQVIGHGINEAFTLPAQILPAVYIAGKAALDARMAMGVGGGVGGSSSAKAELNNLGSSLARESPVAQLATGHPGRALNALGRHPVGGALEVSGAVGAVDRAAGSLARAGAMGADMKAATSLAEPGATTLSRSPHDLLFGAKEAQPPLDKRLTVRLRQGSTDSTARPGQDVSFKDQTLGKNLGPRLVKHLDQKNGEIRAVQKHNVTEAIRDRTLPLRGVPIKDGNGFHVAIPGRGSENLFARGLLADPKIMGPKGDPLWREQLKGLIDMHAKPVTGESEYQKGMREDVLGHLQAHMEDPRLAREGGFKAKAAAVKYAQDMQPVERELVRLKILSPQSARVAKLVDPFQFHWRDQQPLVDETPPLNAKGQAYAAANKAREDALTARRGSLVEKRRAEVSGDHARLAGIDERHAVNVAAHKAAVQDRNRLAPTDPLEHHDSPFSIVAPRKAGRPPTAERVRVPVDQVEKELLSKHGVDPKEIGFVSNKPFLNKDGGYYKNGQNPESQGYNPQKTRTGTAFTRGLYDPTSEALIRQHASNQGIVDATQASHLQVKDYFGTKEHAAKLLEEGLEKPSVTAETRARVQPLIAELRSGPAYFKAHSGTSAWDHAQHTAAEIKQLTGLDLVPGRIAHPYAPGEQLKAIADKSVESIHDRLDPELWTQDRGLDRFPTDPSLQHEAGTVGLVHQAVAKQMDRYEKQTGNAMGKAIRQAASFWRMGNIAFSPKHPVGLVQELGIRSATGNIGFFSRLRANRAQQVLDRAMEDPKFLAEHPEARYEYDRLQAKVRGTEGIQAINLQEHLTGQNLKDLSEGRAGAAVKALHGLEATKGVGLPVRAAKAVFKGYVKTTQAILRMQEKLLGHQAEMAGFGKHLNNESKRILSHGIPLMRQMNSQVEDIIRGQVLNPDAQAALSRQMINWYGDWTSASPNTKAVLAVAPFFRWWLNSVKFLYVTLPRDHPVKTGLLVALESATAEQRKLIGQGPGSVNKLEESQQGSIPAGKGNVANQQYYTPQGAVSSPLETAAGLFLPEFTSIYKAATGTNPFGETLKNAAGESHTDEHERLLAAALVTLESFLPPVRDAMGVSEGKASKIFDPFKITAERTLSGEPRSTPPKLKLNGERIVVEHTGALEKTGPAEREKR